MIFLLKKFIGCNLNDKNAIYKNLLQYFIFALLLNLFNLIITILYTKITDHSNFSTYRRIMVVYFIIYLILFVVLVLFYLIRGIYFSIKQRREIEIYIFHILIITIITIPMFYVIFYLFLVFGFYYPKVL